MILFNLRLLLLVWKYYFALVQNYSNESTRKNRWLYFVFVFLPTSDICSDMVRQKVLWYLTGNSGIVIMQGNHRLTVASYNLHCLKWGITYLEHLCNDYNIVFVQEHWIVLSDLNCLDRIGKHMACYASSAMDTIYVFVYSLFRTCAMSDPNLFIGPPSIITLNKYTVSQRTSTVFLIITLVIVNQFSKSFYW